jgi:hypothetical protein
MCIAQENIQYFCSKQCFAAIIIIALRLLPCPLAMSAVGLKYSAGMVTSAARFTELNCEHSWAVFTMP